MPTPIFDYRIGYRYTLLRRPQAMGSDYRVSDKREDISQSDKIRLLAEGQFDKSAYDLPPSHQQQKCKGVLLN